MKKKLVALTLALSLTASSVGCSSAWWQNLIDNPIATIQTFEQSVQNILNLAELTWAGIYPFLPANAQAAAQAAYNKAVVAVNAAITLLNDAVQAAAAVQGPAPDFTALMQAVSSAVTTLTAVITQFQSQALPPAGVASLTTSPPVGLVELNQAVAVMHRIGGVK